MLNTSRNALVDGSWTLQKIEDRAICEPFDCGDDDLNEYFHVDAEQYKELLLTQTYCLKESTNPSIALALLDLCNDTVRFEKYRDVVEINLLKGRHDLPSVKLTRLGVQKELQGANIGTHVLNMVKRFFITDNRTGCRLITVDAYNNPRVLHFYDKNGFKPFTDKDSRKVTRALFFDLKRLPSNI